MDFGENLKNAREAKGFTQQHLADKLFVTRQAVSKWECGTRYPDLLTTKCIADILSVSIDSLVSDDEMKQFSEKQGVLHGQKSEKIITTLYAICSLLSMIKLIQGIIGSVIYFSSSETVFYSQATAMNITSLIFYIFVAVISVYAFLKSLNDTITPKAAGAIGIFFYLYPAVRNIITMVFNRPIWSLVIITCVSFVFIMIIYLYFFKNKSQLMKLLCVGSIVSFAAIVAEPMLIIHTLITNGFSEISSLTTFTYATNMFIELAFVSALFAQTIILERKRKLCLNNKL